MTDVFDYAGARDDADALLAEFGAAVSVRRTTNSGTEYTPTQSSADYASLGVVTNLPRWYPAFVNGSDVLRTDRLGLVAAGPLTALAITPTPNDLFVSPDGTVYRIIDAKPIAPAGVAVVFILQLRI